MAWDCRNLANTVHARVIVETLRCEVGHKPSPWSMRYIDWVPYHRWPRGERNTGGRCLNCGKTLADVTVRINPKTGEPVCKASRLARDIALTPTDVPPIVFMGRAG